MVRASFLSVFVFRHWALHKVGDQKGVDDDNPVAPCGKIGEEGYVGAGSGFQAEKEGAILFQMNHQFLEALPVHCCGESEDLLTTPINGTGVKLVFGHIDPDEQRHTHLLHHERKSRDRLRPSLHGHEGSKAQSTHQGSRRRGTD